MRRVMKSGTGIRAVAHSHLDLVLFNLPMVRLLSRPPTRTAVTSNTAMSGSAIALPPPRPIVQATPHLVPNLPVQLLPQLATCHSRV